MKRKILCAGLALSMMLAMAGCMLPQGLPMESASAPPSDGAAQSVDSAPEKVVALPDSDIPELTYGMPRDEFVRLMGSEPTLGRNADIMLYDDRKAFGETVQINADFGADNALRMLRITRAYSMQEQATESCATWRAALYGLLLPEEPTEQIEQASDYPFYIHKEGEGQFAMLDLVVDENTSPPTYMACLYLCSRSYADSWVNERSHPLPY